MKPKVSVVMPLYRNADSLTRSLDSILNQDYDGPIEVILMYDDAKDGTREVAESYIASHPGKVRLIDHNGTPFGLGGARKEAMQYLDGEYIYSLDADDAMVPGALNILVDTLEKSGADMVNANFYEIMGEKQKTYFFKKEATYDKYGALNALFSDTSFRSFLWAKLYRRKLLASRPMAILQGKGVMFEDLSLVTSLLLGAEKVVAIKDPVVYYAQDVATSSSTETRKDRALRHLAAFALSRLVLEKSGDPIALKTFLSHRFRTSLSISYDIGRDKKGGADKSYVKTVKKAFKELFKKGAFHPEAAPYAAYLENAFIA